jgi:hypothetical protein
MNQEQQVDEFDLHYYGGLNHEEALQQALADLESIEEHLERKLIEGTVNASLRQTVETAVTEMRSLIGNFERLEHHDGQPDWSRFGQLLTAAKELLLELG